jgi:hypothetical protein
MTQWNPVLATRFLRPSYAKPFRKLVIARSVSDEAIHATVKGWIASLRSQ